MALKLLVEIAMEDLVDLEQERDEEEELVHAVIGFVSIPSVRSFWNRRRFVDTIFS